MKPKAKLYKNEDGVWTIDLEYKNNIVLMTDRPTSICVGKNGSTIFRWHYDSWYEGLKSLVKMEWSPPLRVYNSDQGGPYQLEDPNP